MQFALLRSDRLFLVDCEVTKTQVNAGWVYLDGYLQPTETVTDGEIDLLIQIHPSIQQIQLPTEFFTANEPIEFIRC